MSPLGLELLVQATLAPMWWRRETEEGGMYRIEM